MPLVVPGAEPIDTPLSAAHEKARKINPAFTEGELVRVAETAREVLMQAELGPQGGQASRGPRPLVLAGAILGGGLAAALLAWLLQGA